VARNRSQSVFEQDSLAIVRNAALVAYGIELPDIYCYMILAGRMLFRDAVRAFKCEDGGKNKLVH